MKITQSRSLFFLLLLFTGFHSLQAEIVTVDFQKVFESYYELKIEDQKLREEVAAFQQNQQAKVEALQAKQKAFMDLRNQAAQPEVTDDERKSMVKEATAALEGLNQQEQELRQERAQFQKDLEAKGVRLRRGIVDKVNAKIASLAAVNGWDVVLDSSAKSPNGLTVVAFSADAVDRTNVVIEALNMRSAAVPAAPESAE